jgi:hypothetical protein
MLMIALAAIPLAYVAYRGRQRNRARWDEFDTRHIVRGIKWPDGRITEFEHAVVSVKGDHFVHINGKWVAADFVGGEYLPRSRRWFEWD